MDMDKTRADYHLFIDIQMGKYLKQVRRTEFKSEIEAKTVIGKIIESYNKFIAPENDRLDNSGNEAKTAWFNSVEAEFGDIDKEIDSFGRKFNIEFNKAMDYYDNLFPFLPEKSMTVLIFAGPALEAYGLPLKRFTALLNGDKITEIEKGILLWAYNLSSMTMAGFRQKTKKIRDKFLQEALEIAMEELEEKISIDVVAKIYQNLEEQFTGKNKNIGKKRKQ